MRPGSTVGIVLAGGQARRMGGGDKGRSMVAGRSILARTVACLGGQVSAVAINANGDTARFADLGLAVVADPLPGHLGPLAGILAGLDWAGDAEWVVSVSGDCPFLPDDLVARLHAARRAQGAVYAVAASGGWAHPVIGLWPVACREALRRALAEGERKIDRFTGRHATARAEWGVEPVDPFFNVNSPDDLLAADRYARMMARTAAP